jgi:hypothetical protein
MPLRALQIGFMQGFKNSYVLACKEGSLPSLEKLLGKASNEPVLLGL